MKAWVVNYATPVTIVAMAVAGALVPKVLASGAPDFVKRYAGALRRTGPNQEDSDRQTAGYYQGLISNSSKLSTAGSLVTRHRTREKFWKDAGILHHYRRRNDFLCWEFKPNVDADYIVGRLRTNSFGMPDREYSLEKPPGVWRIAFIGDSISRGWGVEPEARFEELLEARLNRDHLRPDVERIEILNFSVDSYTFTQQVEVALEIAPKFDPDAYVVSMGALAGQRIWGRHLSRVYHEGIDLKYDEMRAIAKAAKLSKFDDPGTLVQKLQPLHRRALQWSLARMREQARKSGTDLVVLLVPLVTDTQLNVDRVARTRELLEEMDIPTMDLLDVFDGVEDYDALRMRPDDHHPNVGGHRMLFDRIYGELQSRAGMRKLLVGD